MDSQLANPPSQGFYFRPEDHSYWLDGREISGFSKIIQDVGIVDLSHIPKDRLEYARERGSKVHEATQYYDELRLDWSSVDPKFMGYVVAWTSFIENEHFVVDLDYIERPTYHKSFHYGVTPDRFGHFSGGHKFGERNAVVEIKCTYDVAPYWGMQTSAQAAALQSHGLAIDPKKVLRMAVVLKGDGSYRLDVHDNTHDLANFMACYRVYGLKRKMK